MKRFYTPADKRKNLKELYQIESVQDYILSIGKLNIDFHEYKKIDSVHEDYIYVDSYIKKLINKSKRIVFLCVYDLKKEAYYLNEFPEKEFILGDVSTSGIKNAENCWTNVKVIEKTLQNYEGEKGDLIIINIAEYFLDQKDLSSFLMNGQHIILNNVHMYKPKVFNFLHSIFIEMRAFSKNIISLFFGTKQMQFRGWWRSFEDFQQAVSGVNKALRSFIFLEKKTNKYYSSYRACIHYEKKT